MPIQDALTGDGYVLAVSGVDERRIVGALDALPAGEHRRQIVSSARAKAQQRALFQVQVHVAVQVDRPGQPGARWDADDAPALLVAGLDGLAEGLCVEAEPIVHRAKAADIKDTIRERRWLNGWHLKGHQHSATFSISRLAMMNGPTPLYSFTITFSPT